MHELFGPLRLSKPEAPKDRHPTQTQILAHIQGISRKQREMLRKLLETCSVRKGGAAKEINKEKE